MAVASSAHISLRQPHLAAEHSRHLRYLGPAPTIIRANAATSNTSSASGDTTNISADDQLYAAREDPALGLRGIPVLGAAAGAIPGTRPESCLDKLARLQVLWMLGATGATAA